MQYKTRGIIIRVKKFAEADRLLTIYTEKKGKISALAKGSRKILSKLAGHLELFYLSDLVIVRGKTIDTLTAAELIEPFINLRQDYALINQAYFVTELVDKLIKENEPAEDVFDLIIKTLKCLDKGGNILLLAYFQLQLLSRLGHKPEFEFCSKCRRRLDSQSRRYLVSGFMTVACGSCASYARDSREISHNAVKILRLISTSDLWSINNLAAEQIFVKEAEDVLLCLVKSVAESEIKTSHFI